MNRRKFLNKDINTPRMLKEIKEAEEAEARRQLAIKADIGVVHKDRMKRWQEASWNEYSSKMGKR